MSLINMTETLDELAYKLETAKQFENDAKLKRIEIENEIIKALGVKPDGSKTFGCDFYKVTTKGVINRKADMGKLEDIRSEIPPSLFPVKDSFDSTKYKYLENNEPELFKKVAQCIVSTPGKSSVTIKRIEETT